MPTHADLKRLKEIKDRERAATPGPWKKQEVNDIDAGVASRGIQQAGGRSLNHGDEYELFEEDDVQFIAAARTDIPWLITKLRSAWRKIDRLQNVVDRQEKSI